MRTAINQSHTPTRTADRPNRPSGGIVKAQLPARRVLQSIFVPQDPSGGHLWSALAYYVFASTQSVRCTLGRGCWLACHRSYASCMPSHNSALMPSKLSVNRRRPQQAAVPMDGKHAQHPLRAHATASTQQLRVTLCTQTGFFSLCVGRG